ncbi:hypothetical protein [Streptomyces sp. NBC_01092]|uniref:hypothetical protein n=1 Tax=Streptomyces sp. NBC_01092 TaxID=2903748 RepID=UPI00386C2EFC|nr:hypothetical protein OG254_06750 [Streptomyces sp. NBC_01092]
MDAGDWISVGSGGVALVAAGIAFWQARTASDSAKHADRQAQAAEEQLSIARQQTQQAERVHREQLALAEQVHREQSEPYVVVDIGPDRPGSPLLVLSIENTGPTMARDLRIRVTPDLVSSHDNLTGRLQRAVARTVPVLPPGRRLVFAFDVYYRRESSGLPMQFDFTVDAAGPAGPVETLTYRVDLEVLQGVLMGESPTKPLEEALGGISRSVDGLTKATARANGGSRRQSDEEMLATLRDLQDGSDGDNM